MNKTELLGPDIFDGPIQRLCSKFHEDNFDMNLTHKAVLERRNLEWYYKLNSLKMKYEKLTDVSKFDTIIKSLIVEYKPTSYLKTLDKYRDKENSNLFHVIIGSHRFHFKSLECPSAGCCAGCSKGTCAKIQFIGIDKIINSDISEVFFKNNDNTNSGRIPENNFLDRIERLEVSLRNLLISSIILVILSFISFLLSLMNLIN